MILGKNRKFTFFFFWVLNENSLEIMSHDHLVRKQALLDYKKWILHSSDIGIFFRGVNP